MGGDLGILIRLVGERVELAQGVRLVAGGQTRQRPIQSGRGDVGTVRVCSQVPIERRHGVAVVHGKVAGPTQHKGVDLAGGAQVVEQTQGVGGGARRRKLVERGLQRQDRGIALAQVAADLGETEQLLAER